MGVFTADFETTVDFDDCRVWAYSLCEIEPPFQTYYGVSINELFDYVKTTNNTLYFHNLKFDGEFILYWLHENGYEHVKTPKDLETKTYTTLISDRGIWYTMKICHLKRGRKKIVTTIIDSLKILNFSVAQIAEAFNLPIRKLEIDYKAYREPGHQLTQEEADYVCNDVKIVAMALYNLFEQGLNKITQGSNALADYKKIIGKWNWKDWFPVLDKETDAAIRLSYKGGFTYLAPRFKNKIVGEVSVFDVNSLYPSQMKYRMLPYGQPIHFEGEYKEIPGYPLYTQRFQCIFELKKNHIPTVQIKNNPRFVETEYLTSSGEDYVNLCMTSVDFELFKEHYNIYDITYLDGYAFKARTGMFDNYIDKWMKIKEESTINGNGAMRTLAKLMLNALYGKFGTRIDVQSKYPVFDDEGMLHFRLGPEEEREPVYIPVASFITAWARYTTITAAQQVYDRFIYADTDSLHLEGLEIPENLDVDATRLGAWDYEMQADKAKYIRQKTYMEHPCGKSAEKYKKKQPELYEACKGWKITCAGMPKSCYQYVTLDNFTEATTFDGKLMPKHVKGGIVLADTTFTIK